LFLTRPARASAAATALAELPFSTTKRTSWVFAGFSLSQEIPRIAVARRMRVSSLRLDFFKM